MAFAAGSLSGTKILAITNDSRTFIYDKSQSIPGGQNLRTGTFSTRAAGKRPGDRRSSRPITRSFFSYRGHGVPRGRQALHLVRGPARRRPHASSGAGSWP